MKRFVKIILGVATAWPVVYLALLITSLLSLAVYNALIPPARKPGIWFETLMSMQWLMLPLWLILSIIYIANVYINDRVDKPSKLLWAVILFIGATVAMPIYWYLYIWREPPSDPKSPHHWPAQDSDWSNRPKANRLQRITQFFFPKVTVFLASTFDDLQVERVAVASELLWSDLEVIKMEYDKEKKNDDSYAKTWIDKNLQKSYIVLFLLGSDRGSLSPLLIPYTQLEMLEAVRLKKRILIYNLHKPFTDASVLDAHYRAPEKIELSSVPRYIPEKERIPYVLGPGQAKISKMMKGRTYEFLQGTFKSTFIGLTPPKEAPPAKDVYSAGELLERIKFDIAPLAAGVRIARIIAYILILWMLSIIFFSLLKA